MPTLRERATDYVTREIETHVPRLWRARAQLYVPLLVDRLVAFVEAVRGDVETDINDALLGAEGRR